MRRNEIAIEMIKAAPTDAYLGERRVLGNISDHRLVPALRAMMAAPNFDPNGRAGGTPLLVNLAFEGNAEGVQLLLNRPDLDATARKQTDGVTALMAAAWSPIPRVVAVLLADKRIDPNAVTQDGGDSALHVAAWKGRAGAISLLLADERVDANILNKAGESPLAIAIEQGWFAVAPFLEWEKVAVSAEQKAQIAQIRPKP